MGKPVELTDKNFEEIISTNKPVLIDFWADWCGPCKMMAPVVDELAKEFDKNAIVGKVNVDNNPELSAKYGVRSIPTFLFIKNNDVVDTVVGAVSKESISKKLTSLKD